jgi:hypothetical protein
MQESMFSNSLAAKAGLQLSAPTSEFSISKIVEWDSVHPKYWKLGGNVNRAKRSSMESRSLSSISSGSSPELVISIKNVMEFRELVKNRPILKTSGKYCVSNHQELLRVFSLIVNLCKLNYRLIGRKLGVNEEQTLNFCLADKKVLPHAYRIFFKWIFSFCSWISSFDVSKSNNFNISLEKIIPNEKNLNLDKFLDKKTKTLIEHLSTNITLKDVISLLMIGDMIEAQDDAGNWQPLYLVEKKDYFLKLFFLGATAPEFWIDPLKQNLSSFYRIPLETLSILKQRIYSFSSS